LWRANCMLADDLDGAMVSTEIIEVTIAAGVKRNELVNPTGPSLPMAKWFGVRRPARP